MGARNASSAPANVTNRERYRLGTYVRMPGATNEDDRGDEGDRQQQHGDEGSGHEICIVRPARDLRVSRARLTAEPGRLEIAT
jgi:hypothetical protein